MPVGTVPSISFALDSERRIVRDALRMAAIHGSFSEGAPVVGITLESAVGSTACTAVVDTGFDGFSAIPISVAALLDLQAGAAAEVEYADGNVATVDLVRAWIVLGAEAREGLIHAQPHTEEILVGLDFLRAFQKVLILSVSDERLLLVDDLAEIGDLLRESG
jgi:predicted aspartyl protease